MMTQLLEYGQEETWRSWLSNMESYSCVVLCDTNTFQHCYPKAQAEQILPQHHQLIVVPAGEASKSFEQVVQIVEQMHVAGVGKKSILICLGGGMICDLGGFIAHIYMRGIQLAHIPTTLLCMADACLGGKNGIDFQGVKNQIGSIHHPEAIWINAAFLNTLDERTKKSGIAEMIKHTLLQSEDAFDHACQLPVTAFYDTRQILAGLRFKQKITQQDEADLGLRQILNFGHSIGHAIESESYTRDQSLLHGEAILLGMRYELRLSHLYLGCSMEILHQYERFFETIFPGLKFEARVDDLLPYLNRDKKNNQGYRMSLLKNPGHPQTGVLVSAEAIYKCFQDDLFL